MAERDYVKAREAPKNPVYLPGTRIELLVGRDLRARRPAQPPRHVLFDFDGTLSLVREGWVDIMVPLLAGHLMPFAKPNETPASIELLVREFVTRLTGKQTIYQMMALADEIKKRGGTPAAPLDYKAEYHDRLMARIASRREGLASGKISREEMLVPGSLDLLNGLVERGATLYIASGTDEQYVLEEARLLGLDTYAPGRVYGALADIAGFSKEMVIRRILSENRVDGASLLGFGDGYVEIADTKAAGGFAIAVATDEANRSGLCDEWKRERLIGAGADIVIPDYREAARLLEYLYKEVS